MIAIVDYGVGNLFSLNSSLKALGVNSVVTSDEKVLSDASAVILPGVGAFGDAVQKLKSSGLDKCVVDEAKNGKPLLGICLGMQMLFDKSFEYGENDGLKLVSGEIVPMEGTLPPALKIPHIGWNSLKFTNKSSKLFKYINDGDFVYFVHSYFAGNCDSSVTAYTEYGIPLTASVESGNIFGCQFHPEKSGEVGLKILKAFCETGESI